LEGDVMSLLNTAWYNLENLFEPGIGEIAGVD